MADTKITALTAIGANPIIPSTFPIPMVDLTDTSMAASGTTKKVTVNQILQAGGTATLSSATITGDLTARNWFVTGGSLPGVGNSNPFAYRIGGGGLGIGAATETGTTAPIVFYAGQGGIEQYRIAPLGVFTWSDGAGGTRMTLNSTGLGVGGSASARIHAIDSSGVCGLFTRAAAPAAALSAAYITAPVSSGFSNSPVYGFWYQNTGISNPANECFAIRTSSTDRLYVDATGNVGIGVTPSAWATGTYKSLQIGQSSSISAGVASELVVVGSNCYFDTTDSRWERITSGYTSQYYQTGGTHVWRIGGTAGANTDCSFTSAMTLESTGSLVLGAAAVATTATDGFLYIPGCAGTPTGTPTAKTGRVPLVVDTTNNKLYFYSGGAWVAAN